MIIIYIFVYFVAALCQTTRDLSSHHNGNSPEPERAVFRYYRLLVSIVIIAAFPSGLIRSLLIADKIRRGAFDFKILFKKYIFIKFIYICIITEGLF